MISRVVTSDLVPRSATKGSNMKWVRSTQEARGGESPPDPNGDLCECTKDLLQLTFYRPIVKAFNMFSWYACCFLCRQHACQALMKTHPTSIISHQDWLHPLQALVEECQQSGLSTNMKAAARQLWLSAVAHSGIRTDAFARCGFSCLTGCAENAPNWLIIPYMHPVLQSQVHWPLQ